MSGQLSLISYQEDIGRKIIDLFEGRLDKMSYRSVSVYEDTSGGAKPAHTLPAGALGSSDLVARKMAVKFDRNPDLVGFNRRIRMNKYWLDGLILRRWLLH